jgi:hypothetical protein
MVVVCGSALAVAFGCGGGSGIDSSDTLGSLTVAEQMTECNYLASEYPQKQIDCGSGQTITVGSTASDCSGSNFDPIPSTCTVTVGQLEDCDAALYDEGSAACTSTTTPAACQPLVNAGSACGEGSGS